MNYDLIVIGAGTLGTFHAYHALRQGKKVLLLEKDPQPQEASVRNFGQVIPSGMAFGGGWFEAGRESARLYQVLQQHADLSVRANGSYYIASDADELTLIEELAALLAERGYPADLLTQQACLEKIPTLRREYCLGGLWAGEDLSVEPRLLIHRVRGLLQSQFGLHYQPNTAVVGCELKAVGCRVHTAAGEVFRADYVAVCNGRDFNLLFPDLFAQSGLKVVKLNMMQTAPLPGVQLPGNVLSGLSIRRYESFESCPSHTRIAAAAPAWQAPYRAGGVHILFKQAPDGSVVLGDSHEYAPVGEVLDFALRTDLNDLILAEAQRMMDFPTWQLQSLWAGFYSQTADGGAYTHTLDGRIFIATGIGGKGMTTGPAFARQCVARIFAGA